MKTGISEFDLSLNVKCTREKWSFKYIRASFFSGGTYASYPSGCNFFPLHHVLLKFSAN